MSITLKDGTIIDDLLVNNPKITTFLFSAGTYYMNKVLHIDKPGIKLIGLDNASKVHIIQNNSKMDGISFKYADKSEMRNISLHVPHDDKVCFTLASCNLTKVENCYFYGNANTFTVYYAGPSQLIQGQNTLSGYSKNILDRQNVFRRNVVYSNWSGDNVAFCLQSRSIFSYNIVRGGKVAVYMCKNSWVTCNRLYDSVGNGFFISLPSHGVEVKYNYIYECSDSAIVIRNQVEHGDFKKSPYHLVIKENYIYDAKDHAIECNDADTVIFDKNTCISTDIYGLYCLRCNNITIINNKIAYFKVATWFEQTSNCIVNNNEILSIFPSYGDNVIKITNHSDNNKFDSNKISGKILYDIAPISADSINNVVTNSIITPYHTYAEELDILNKYV